MIIKFRSNLPKYVSHRFIWRQDKNYICSRNKIGGDHVRVEAGDNNTNKAMASEEGILQTILPWSEQELEEEHQQIFRMKNRWFKMLKYFNTIAIHVVIIHRCNHWMMLCLPFVVRKKCSIHSQTGVMKNGKTRNNKCKSNQPLWKRK